MCNSKSIDVKTSKDPSCRISAHDFVLGKFGDEELEKILELSGEIEKVL